jgi:hypothetical protein
MMITVLLETRQCNRYNCFGETYCFQFHTLFYPEDQAAGSSSMFIAIFQTRRRHKDDTIFYNHCWESLDLRILVSPTNSHSINCYKYNIYSSYRRRYSHIQPSRLYYHNCLYIKNHRGLGLRANYTDRAINICTYAH